MALLAGEKELYRIGGMQAQNESERPHDLFSLSEVAAFDPDTRTWRRLADLPDPRSSHRAAILQDRIYVFGGWTLQGGEDGVWLDHGLVLDRKSESAGWTKISQPSQLRALEVIAYGGKVWLIGGLTPEAEISRKIHVYDVAIITRAAPARILGLKNKGHLGLGADADITIYAPDNDRRWMFERPRWVIMGGRIAAEDGDIRESLFGDTHFVLPEYDSGALPGIQDWFEQHYTVQFHNYPVDDHHIESPSPVACEAAS